MTTLLVVRWVHLVAAATWLGGLIVMGPLVLALRRAGADRPMLQAAARGFGQVTWSAMAVAVVTGLAQVWLMHLPWAYQNLQVKIGAVVLAVALAAFHQVTAREASPRARGIAQALILVASLGIFAAAVRL